jgi:hypothetical protein
MTRAPAPSDDDAPAWLRAGPPADDGSGGGLTGLRLARALARLAEIGAASCDRDVREVADMIGGWLRDRARVPFDRWIGAREPGRGSMAEALRIEDRDVLLRAAADLPPYAGLSRHGAAHLIAQRWGRWHEAHAGRLPAAPPADREGELFWRLARDGHEPASPSTIRRALARET